MPLTILLGIGSSELLSFLIPISRKHSPRTEIVEAFYLFLTLALSGAHVWGHGSIQPQTASVLILTLTLSLPHYPILLFARK